MMRIDLSDEYQSRDPDAKNNCRKIGQEPMLARHEKCHDNADRNEEKKSCGQQLNGAIDCAIEAIWDRTAWIISHWNWPSAENMGHMESQDIKESNPHHRQQGNDDLNGSEYFDYFAVIADCVAGLFHGLLLFYPSRLAR